jgi:sulfur carrier protein
MNVFVNNSLLEIPTRSKVAEALETLNIISAKGIAIAVNGNVIPRAEWEQFELNSEDKITVIKATQGG